MLKQIRTKGAYYISMPNGWKWQLFTFPIILQWYQQENEDKLLYQLTKILEEDDENEKDN